MYTGGPVAPLTKHLLNAVAYSAGATSVPAVLMLVDLLGYYPMTTTTVVRKSIHVQLWSLYCR